MSAPEEEADLSAAEEQLRRYALAKSGAEEHFPWGDRVVKVRGKIFLFLGRPGEELSLSVKLPASREFALDYPFTKPTGYGLGKAGWVTCRFESGESVPLDVMRAWIDESYAAIAPKRLQKEAAADRH